MRYVGMRSNATLPLKAGGPDITMLLRDRSYVCLLTCFGLALPLAGRGLGWEGGSRGVG